MFDTESRQRKWNEIHAILDRMTGMPDHELTLRELENGLVELLHARRMLRSHRVELTRALANRVREKPHNPRRLPDDGESG